MSRGARIIAITLGVAILAAAVGWFAGSRLQSREEAQAETAPPEPSLITVEVERVELSNTVVVRGTVQFSDSTSLAIGPNYQGVSILTNILAAEGELIEDGAPIAEVGGRPVFVLEGVLPAFRDLGPGATGDDVEQLEEALARLGHEPGPVDGAYDGDTESAVTAFYETNGYEPQPRSPDERAQIDTAEAGVEAARDQVRAAEQTLAAARRPLPESQRLILDQQVSDAERLLETAKADTATRLVELEDTLAAAEDLVAATGEAAALAADRLAQAEAGTHPDTGQPPSEDELAVLAAEAAEAEATWMAAVVDRDDAQAALDAAESEPDPAVEDAEQALAIARATRSEALAAPDTTFETRAVSDARNSLAAATAELEELEAQFGVRVPATEILYMDTLPRRVDGVLRERGDDVTTGALMQVSGATLVIDSGVSAADRSLLDVGDRALVEDEALGVSFEALITELADSPGGPQVASDRYYLRLEPLTDPGEDVQGLNLRVTIPVTSTDGEVLAVPLAALFAAADGTTRVEVANGDGTTSLVDVETGLEGRAAGLVEVRPLSGSLSEGDLVVVGR